ncbi:calcium-binding protein [Pseudooceanicola sp.]|uniref:calcium-binding protein n=1 Tax=Pseudooceanicola sp. TaxID=1914328 RepID=UPI0035C786A0
MFELTHRTTLTGENPALYGLVETLTPLSDAALAQHWVFAGSAATGAISRYRLNDLASFGSPDVGVIASPSPVFRISDLVLVGDDPVLWAAGIGEGQITGFSLDSSGGLTAPQSITAPLRAPVSEMEVIRRGGREFLITGSRDAGDLEIYEWVGSHHLVHRHTAEDHAKAAFGSGDDMTRLTVGAETFLVTASTREGAISTLRIGPDGSPELVDTLGPKDGLWVSGLDAIAPATAHGAGYIVVAAVNSSSLSLVRVNDIGVMFVEDHLLDGLDTRFARADAVTAFSVGERGFVVAGGGDDGLSLLEILPDRSFLPHGVLVNVEGGALQNIAAIAAVDTGQEIQVIAAGQPGLTLATLDRAVIGAAQQGGAAGDVLTGGHSGDLLWGAAGDDILRGNAGADILAGGAGQDTLTGGAGADVFVFDDNPSRDLVTDFELGEDRIDLSRWGRIYDASALTIDSRWDGADIHYGDLSLRLASADGQRLTEDDLTNDVFLF